MTLEFGLGVGFNSDYWNIGSSKIGTRAGAVSVFEKTQGADLAKGLNAGIGAGVWAAARSTKVGEEGPLALADKALLDARQRIVGILQAGGTPALSDFASVNTALLTRNGTESAVQAAANAVKVTGSDFSGSGSAN